MKLSGIFVALALVALPGFASASVSTAVSFTKDSGGEGTSSFTRGFYFSLSDSVTIAALGWYDSGGDGLVSSHEIGIWNDTGQLLLSGMVSSGTADPLEGFFRYTASLTGDAALTPGSYVIGGLSTVSDRSYRRLDASSVIFGPFISYISDASNAQSAVFSEPTWPAGFDIGYFGPNFQYVSGVPETGTWGMLAVGFAVLGAASRRRARALPV